MDHKLIEASLNVVMIDIPLTLFGGLQEDRTLSEASLKRTIALFLAGKLRVVGGNQAADDDDEN